MLTFLFPLHTHSHTRAHTHTRTHLSSNDSSPCKGQGSSWTKFIPKEKNKCCVQPALGFAHKTF